MYSVLFLAALCAGVHANFTTAGQEAIVNLHNTMRSSIAKGLYIAKDALKSQGTNVLKMKWNATLATSAQTYANSCPTGHSNLAGIGENLYWYWTSGTLRAMDILGAAAAKSWEKEFQDFGWSSNLFTMDLFNSGIGHATQMAWASTGQIGCGVNRCGVDPENSLNKFIVVCHYKAQGNYLDQYIYTTGTTCSACPTGTTCDTTLGLCQ